MRYLDQRYGDWLRARQIMKQDVAGLDVLCHLKKPYFPNTAIDIIASFLMPDSDMYSPGSVTGLWQRFRHLFPLFRRGGVNQR